MTPQPAALSLGFILLGATNKALPSFRCFLGRSHNTAISYHGPVRQVAGDSRRLLTAKHEVIGSVAGPRARKVSGTNNERERRKRGVPEAMTERTCGGITPVPPPPPTPQHHHHLHHHSHWTVLSWGNARPTTPPNMIPNDLQSDSTC